MAIENLRSFLKNQLENASAMHIDFLCKEHAGFADTIQDSEKMVDFIIDNDLTDNYFRHYIKLKDKAEFVSLFHDLSMDDPKLDEKIEGISNHRKLIQIPSGGYYLSDFY